VTVSTQQVVLGEPPFEVRVYLAAQKVPSAVDASGERVVLPWIEMPPEDAQRLVKTLQDVLVLTKANLLPGGKAEALMIGAMYQPKSLPAPSFS
jgi:hypothetical protein